MLLCITIAHPATRETVSDLSALRTQVAHQSQRTQTTAHIAAEIDDQSPHTTILEFIDRKIKISSKLLPHGSGKSCNLYQPNIRLKHLIRQSLGLNHRRPIFGRFVWNFNRDMANQPLKIFEAELVLRANIELCSPRRSDRLGIDCQKEFAGSDSGTRGYTIFDNIHEHPALSVLRCLGRTQRRVYRIGRWNSGLMTMEKCRMTAPQFV